MVVTAKEDMEEEWTRIVDKQRREEEGEWVGKEEDEEAVPRVPEMKERERERNGPNR